LNVGNNVEGGGARGGGAVECKKTQSIEKKKKKCQTVEKINLTLGKENRSTRH